MFYVIFLNALCAGCIISCLKVDINLFTFWLLKRTIFNFLNDNRLYCFVYIIRSTSYYVFKHTLLIITRKSKCCIWMCINLRINIVAMRAFWWARICLCIRTRINVQYASERTAYMYMSFVNLIKNKNNWKNSESKFQFILSCTCVVPFNLLIYFIIVIRVPYPMHRTSCLGWFFWANW